LRVALGLDFGGVQFGSDLALDHEACIQMLRECKFLSAGAMSVVKLYTIPDGLSAEGWWGICGKTAQ